jgi:hypothetical protein
MAALERPLSADSGDGDEVFIVGELFWSIPKTGAPRKPNDTRECDQQCNDYPAQEWVQH